MRRLALFLLATLTATGQPSADQFFESRVRPLFAAKCQECHGAKLQLGGFDLLSADGFRKSPGPQRLLAAIEHNGKIRMPPASKLQPAEIAALKEWVRLGTPWPANSSVDKASSPGWWSFQPLQAPASATIDSLLAARRKEKGLAAAPRADKLTLIRRATFDLTGLPPTEEEIRTFLSNTSPDAFAKVIDRLLASPRYGERWGRHWLDVARYADSTGVDEDHRYPHAWRYRDYVIDAFNRDLPYDQFVREQIAGDLLLPVTPRGIVATGFLALGPKLIAEQDKVKMFYDAVDEQIDVTGKAFLGLTIACARCHDHKFDPISTKDYYSLASIFANTRQWSKLEGTVSQLYFVPLVDRATATQYETHKKLVEAKQKEIDDVLAKEQARYADSLAPHLAEYMVAAYDVYHNASTASHRGLQADVIRRWAEYLKPIEERRPQLEAFYQAEDKAAAARVYQADFIAHTEERRKNKERKYLAGDNRFYTEVTAAKGPFGLPEKERDELIAQLNAEMKTLKAAAPPEPPLACAVSDGDAPYPDKDGHVFVRGNADTLGDKVGKRFPLVLAGDKQSEITRGSGRLELAHWISSPDHPLTARVMANRIWQWHFGEGIVRTPSNFGKLGDKPTHPELLDWLARKLIDNGWSIKAMHHVIMLSDAYQMSGLAPADSLQQDSDNRLWTRFPQRRLTVEEIRDAMLFIDGTLDLAMGGTFQEGAGTDKEFAEGRKSISPDTVPRRLVYLPLRRSNLSTLLNLFDFGDASTSGDGRTQTNNAPQALYMMNSPSVEQRAKNLAAKFGDDVERAWWGILNRPPAATDLAQAREYIARFPGDHALALTSFYRTLLASNDFLYVH
jgi:hypothetical protein